MSYPDTTFGSAVKPAYDLGTAGGANDVLNRVGRIHQSVLPAWEFVEYGFAGASRDTLIALGSGVKLAFGTGANNYDGYDRFGRVLRMKWEKDLVASSANDVKEWIEWDYDRVSNRKWRWNRNAATSKGQDELYTYDGLYRLKVADRGTLNGTKTAITSSKHKEEWTDDLMGNWTGWKTFLNGSATATPNQTRAHNVTNEITSVSPGGGIQYDTVGNTTQSRPDPAGTWGSAQNLQWDAWNRLVWRAGDTYRFDALPRRITKTVSSVIRHFYYSDQWQIVEERVGSATTADNQYVWGMRYIDELIYRRRGTTERYVLTDYFHPVAITDTTGNVIERFGYTPFGVVRFMNAAQEQPFSALRLELSYDQKFWSCLCR